MAGKIFQCKFHSVELNEFVTITFAPSTVADIAAAEVVACVPESFVLQNLDLYSWNNDITIGISNPQKVSINIRFDLLQNSLSTDDQTYLFNAIMQPFQQVTIYEGEYKVVKDGNGVDQEVEAWKYSTCVSNYVKIESATLGVLHFMQDVYSNIDLDVGLVDINLSCTDLVSNLLKNISCEKTINYVLDHLETLGTLGVDYDYSKFAFDWINAQADDPFYVTNSGVMPPNKLYKKYYPFGAVISGQPKLDGSNGDNSTLVINNFAIQHNSIPQQQRGDNFVPSSFQQYPARYVYEDVARGSTVTNNGLQRLEFVNIQSFYNLVLQQANVLLSRYNVSINENVQVYFDMFYKQLYDGSFTVGDKLGANAWFLYKVRGCGTYVASKTGGGYEWKDTEYYYTNQDITKQLQFSSVYDLLTDVLLSSLNAFVLTETGFANYAPPTDVVELDWRLASIGTSVSFNYKVVNIQTGRADLDTPPDTTTVMPAPGTAENINIPCFYHSYPIQPGRGFNHSFVVNTSNNTDVLENKPTKNIEALYLIDSQINEITGINEPFDAVGVSAPEIAWQDLGNNPYDIYENWGNCGFYCQDNNVQVDNANANVYQNAPPTFYYAMWLCAANFIYTLSYHPGNLYLNIGRTPSHHGGSTGGQYYENIPNTLRSRRPIDMFHLNSINFSCIKVWYREQYGTITSGQDNTSFLAVYPDRYTFVSAHHTGDNTLSNTEIPGQAGYSFTDFFWPYRVDGNNSWYSDRGGGGDNAKFLGSEGLGVGSNMLWNNLLTQTNSFDKVKELYTKYVELCTAQFDANWYQTLYNKIAGSYISRIIEIKVKPAQVKNIFNNIALTDLKNYLFDITLTDDPIKKILNTKYKVISIALDGEDFTIRLTTAVE